MNNFVNLSTVNKWFADELAKHILIVASIIGAQIRGGIIEEQTRERRGGEQKGVEEMWKFEITKHSMETGRIFYSLKAEQKKKLF